MTSPATSAKNMRPKNIREILGNSLEDGNNELTKRKFHKIRGRGNHPCTVDLIRIFFLNQLVLKTCILIQYFILNT